jgi:hypothetical protein
MSVCVTLGFDFLSTKQLKSEEPKSRPKSIKKSKKCKKAKNGHKILKKKLKKIKKTHQKSAFSLSPSRAKI